MMMPVLENEACLLAFTDIYIIKAFILHSGKPRGSSLCWNGKQLLDAKIFRYYIILVYSHKTVEDGKTLYIDPWLSIHS